MNRVVVVDTSVAFKWFSNVDEAGVEEAVALLAAHHEGTVELVAPVSLHLELANALRYSGHAPATVLSLVENLGLPHIELADITTSRLRAATALAYRHGISVYDALFLALAEELDCPLVTADRRAFEGAETGVEIRVL